MLFRREPKTRRRSMADKVGLGQARKRSGATVAATPLGGVIDRQPQVMLYTRGPKTRPRPTYTKTGIGQVKQVRGNPVSWGLDCLGRCWPFLTLRGGQDEASQALRGATADSLRPRQVRLQSRGILGIFEGAGGSGGTPQVYSTGEPIPELASSTSGDSPNGGSEPDPTCPEGLVYVQLGGGKFKCATPWGN